MTYTGIVGELPVFIELPPDVEVPQAQIWNPATGEMDMVLLAPVSGVLYATVGTVTSFVFTAEGDLILV